MFMTRLSSPNLRPPPSESDIDSWRDVERQADKQARSPLSLDIFDQAAVKKVPFQCRYDDGARDQP